MMNRLSVLIPLIILFSSACSNYVTQSPTQTIVSTSTATNTYTNTPTTKPTSTPTIEPTSTSTASPNVTNTHTPEPTPEGPPAVWTENELTITDFELSGYIGYADSAGVIKGWYNTETNELMSGGYSEWIPKDQYGQPYTYIDTREIVKFRVILTNKDSTFIDAHKIPHRVLEGKEENAARIFAEIMGVNWALENKNIELSRRNTQPATLEKKFQMVAEYTRGFIKSLANGTLIDEIGGTMNMGNIHALISKFDTVIVEMSANPKASTSFSPNSPHWVLTTVNDFGYLKLIIDPHPSSHDPKKHNVGGVFGIAVRILVNKEVRNLSGAPTDLSGVIILKACGQKDFSGVEKPDWAGEESGVPFGFWGDDNLDYKACAIGNF